MVNVFGSERIRSVELFFDPLSGWSIRAFDERARSGASAYLLVSAGDVSLTAAATVTVPGILIRDGLTLSDGWRIDESAHTAWADVTPVVPRIVTDARSLSFLSDAELRWLALGIGRLPAAPPRRARRRGTSERDRRS